MRRGRAGAEGRSAPGPFRNEIRLRPTALVDDFFEFSSEAVGSERLLKKMNAGRERAVLDDRVVGVTREVQDLETRADDDGAFRELATRRSRHHDVRDQYVDLLDRAAHVDRFRRRLGFENGIAVLSKDLDDGPPHARVVLDAEGGLRAG